MCERRSAGHFRVLPVHGCMRDAECPAMQIAASEAARANKAQEDHKAILSVTADSLDASTLNRHIDNWIDKFRSLFGYVHRTSCR